MRLNIKELKELMSKIDLAVEKSRLNPKSGWIELETCLNTLKFKVSNYDYYLESSINVDLEENDRLHVTILAETFVPLISKLDVETINVYEKLNSLIVETDQSSYTFPVIKELGKTRSVDVIDFESTLKSDNYVSGIDLASVAIVNTKGLVDAVFAKEIQQFIYVDNKGALTFTENIYVNDFKYVDATKCPTEFKMLLNITQAKLLGIFKNIEDVKIDFEQKPTFSTQSTTTNKVCLSANNIKLILVAQNLDYTAKFPSIKLRALAENPEHTHVVIDKKLLDKALSRLMVFDKKFDITVMDYSKLVFRKNELELVSIKNKNFEKIPYVSSQNVIEHEAIIRFADLVNQLKAILSREIDISYGSRPALTINGESIKQVIPEIVINNKV